MTTVLEELNRALYQALEKDPAVVILGEDILDPYGGAFKVTRGLSSAFPDRVITTPISEAGLTGLAAGMALRGLRPVLEIMFGDFITLAADQLINHAAKFRWMYHQAVQVPMVVRLPMGGRRGYGPTHSQTLEKHFLGVPGLRLLAPCDLGTPGELLRQAILETADPVLFIENKLLYLLPVQTAETLTEFELAVHPAGTQPAAPTYSLRLRGAPPAQLTLTAYGYMANLARQAALRLAYEDEIFTEVIIPTQLAPFALEALFQSVAASGRLLTVEEGGRTSGWGAEVLAQTAERLGSRLQAARRLGAADLPIPASGPLENAVLPDVEAIVKIARSMV